MKASVGDRVVVASTRLDGKVRDGRIVEVRSPDGSPPYLVEWSDTKQQALVFPGPDAHVEHLAAEAATDDTPLHVKTWRVQVDVFESSGGTTAHAVLAAESPVHLDADGEARLRPGDQDVPEIGDEVAVARALRRLADRLLAAAEDDIGAIEGHRVNIPG
jgi:hypothetical protein